MQSYRLSREAIADIEAIGDHGLATFGVNQTLKYHLGLEHCFGLLADFPDIGRASDELRPGLYRHGYKAHMIFYTIHTDHLLIVRVLRASMDFSDLF
jgi:toxin ParE1/3/4